MSTISKERLEQLASGNAWVCVQDDEAAELARIALASLEAEPVGEVSEQRDGLVMDGMVDLGGASTHRIIKGASKMKRLPLGTKFYTAPPAPVSVPDERYQHLSELYHAQEKRLFKLAQRIKGASFDKYAYSPSQAIDVLESAIFGEREDECRAAMLQGAELVTTANKLRDAVETIRNSGIEIDAEKIFAERDALNAPVIPDGYCIMPLKLTADNGAKGALCGEFHVQYRIVCQSCVGEGCEDCNHTGGWDAEIPVGWDTIKRIHEAAVEACAMPAAPQQEVK
ncbi:hypothetical protein [Enterobacter hormaechei]|uniref:hypothetical protein n=1 Tax=Enterobacter hormaechei TaxID=158836 RepID=UPI002949695D|nr:hypothetical protein [Enterobacter hormaechei]MDV5434540.1 hypothetical protein [Enterobacter hormaechei]